MRTWPATAATAAFALLAGCSSAAAPATVAVSSPHSATASADGLRERAQALVWRLVNELSPPPGTRTVHLTKLPPPLNNPSSPAAGRLGPSPADPRGPGAAWVRLGRAAGAHAAQADRHDHSWLDGQHRPARTGT